MGNKRVSGSSESRYHHQARKPITSEESFGDRDHHEGPTVSANPIIIQSTNVRTTLAGPADRQGVACVNTTIFLIGRNSRGQWIARARDGLYGGLFVSRADAVRYALFENGHRPEAIVDITGIVELLSRASSEQAAA